MLDIASAARGFAGIQILHLALRQRAQLLHTQQRAVVVAIGSLQLRLQETDGGRGVHLSLEACNR
jgi:hypothetical protein